MSTPLSPWGRALDELLADGKWHELGDVLDVVIPFVPPGPAYRCAERRRARLADAPRSRGTTQTAVLAGARALVHDAIHDRRRRGRIEAAGSSIRATAGGPRA